MESERMALFPNSTQMFSSLSFNQLNNKVGDFGGSRAQSVASDPFKVFTENFDLSLLPNETNVSSSSFVNDQSNIPTTVYQYNDPDLNSSSKNLLPEIKVEENWSNHLTLDNKANEDLLTKNKISLLYEHLSRQQDPSSSLNKSYLIPPPPYPNIYPSPQSSPAQSDYTFSLSHNNGYYESLSSSRSSLYSSSPCPSIDGGFVKQELHILPPSPPDSNCEAHSPRSFSADIKLEPLEIEPEISSIDLNALLEQNRNNCYVKQQNQDNCLDSKGKVEPLLLKEALENKSFQSKFNLKSLALESFIEGLETESEDFEPVISLALEHARKDAEAICNKLQISQDPTAWTSVQVHAWLRSTIEQFKLPFIENLETKFQEDGASLLLLTEEEFIKRVPQGGNTLHAQLEIWKMIYSDECQKINMPSSSYSNSHHSCLPSIPTFSTRNEWTSEMLPNMAMEIDEESECEETPELNGPPNATGDNEVSGSLNSSIMSNKRSGLPSRSGGSHIHLWQFLKELLQAPQLNGTAIRWIDRSKGIFKIEDSVRVAKLWGKRKNRPAMNYDKLSRSIRQYYKKGIMKKTERSQRLVYQFCHPYYL